MPQTPARRAAGRSPDVASLVRLHHRRRGWAWVGTGSAIGLVVYLAIGVDLTGTAGIISVVAVFVLLALQYGWTDSFRVLDGVKWSK